MRVVWPLLLLAASCGGEGASTGRLRATLIRPLNDSLRDTTRFDVPALAQACAEGSGVLLSGARTGNGVLLLVLPGDSELGGTYRARARGDTAGRGALIAARGLVGDVARGVALDTGEVRVAVSDGRISATAHGSGIGVPGAVRVSLEATFDGVAPPRDSVPCRVEP